MRYLTYSVLLSQLQARAALASLQAAHAEVASLRTTGEEAAARSAAAERDVARLRAARNEAQMALKASTDQLIAEQLARKQQVALEPEGLPFLSLHWQQTVFPPPACGPAQEAEAARQAAAMQASLERLQAEREALRRELAEGATKRAEAEAQVSDGCMWGGSLGVPGSPGLQGPL